MSFVRFRREEDGLSLIETLASILLFAIVTIGITPLMISSIRGTALARSQTVGKEVAREAMERIRGLPFYVSYGTQAKKVDLLDLYLPCADPSLNADGCAGGGDRSYDSGTGVFEIACASDTEDPACAVGIPDGYELVFRSRFMDRDGEPSQPPDPDYAWNVDSKDTPRTDLMHMMVTANWVEGGQPRSVSIESLVGDRKFGDVKVAGTGRVDFGVQVRTSYRKVNISEPDEVSDVNAVIGSGESSVESRLVSKADQRFRTAEIRLVRRDESVGVDLDERMGAVEGYQAPPSFSATGGLPSTDALPVMEHPDIAGQDVAFLDATTINAAEVRADAEQPVAKGSFSLPSSSGNLGYVWVQSQKPQGLIDLVTNPLRLDYNRRSMALARGDSGTNQLVGSTEAVTGALGAPDRRVETKGQIDVKEVRLFPVTYIGTGSSFRRSILQVQNFTAQVSCDAKGTSATASASWSATIRYWRHDGGFTSVTVNGNDHGDSDLQTVLGENPLLYQDSSGDEPELYMFDEPGKRGYFTAFRFSSPITSTEGGLTASADVNEAINISTVPTNPEFNESGLSVSIGKLSCSALDAR